jgi:hypothetical protein
MLEGFVCCMSVLVFIVDRRIIMIISYVVRLRFSQLG